ncbi:MAG: translocation/assembly module TamB [Pseudoflavonifractor sp.]|nr:translocation/assembly module TamB [Pseudoflavonifractor sp.]
MKWVYKTLRAILVATIALALGLPVLLYVALSLPPVQEKARDIAEDELSRLFDTRVSIGNVSISPFNRVTLSHVSIEDDNGNTALDIDRLGAGISLSDSFINRRIVISYVELIGADARLYKPTPDAPLNIARIIQALSPKDRKKPPTRFDLSIYNIVIRQLSFSYDVLSEPAVDGRFDPKHIHVNDFKADVTLPRLKNDDFVIDVRRLMFNERSGLSLSGLTGKFHITKERATIDDLVVELPATRLSFADMAIDYGDLSTIGTRLTNLPLKVSILDGSHISPDDLASFAPVLKGLDETLDFRLSAEGTANDITLSELHLSGEENRILLHISGRMTGLADKNGNPHADLPDIEINGYGSDISDLVSSIATIPDKSRLIISNLGHISLKGSFAGSLTDASFDGIINTEPGSIDIDATYARDNRHAPIRVAGNVMSEDIALGQLLGQPDLGNTGFDLTFDGTLGQGIRQATLDGTVTHFEYRGYRYDDIVADITLDGQDIAGVMSINDDNIRLAVNGEATIDKELPRADIFVEFSDISLANLNLSHKYPHHRLSGELLANWNGSGIDTGNGTLRLDNVRFTAPGEKGITLDSLMIEAVNTDSLQYINLRSDYIDGAIAGSYNFAHLVPAAREILSTSMPVFFGGTPIVCADNGNIRPNDFSYNFTIKENNQLIEFFNSPVRLVYPITLTGLFSDADRRMNLKVDIPYLQQKDKLIENTALQFNADGNGRGCRLTMTTTMPTKKGAATVTFDGYGNDNRLDTDISWRVARERRFLGNVSLSTLVGRDVNDKGYTADVAINRSELVFNDTVWTVNPAKIDVDLADKRISIDNIDIRRDNQYITIDGTVSDDPDDQLILKLLNINLDYVFETLGIDNVMFGGDATGQFLASGLFSKEPRLLTPGLHVDGLRYNWSLLGDADIRSEWHNDTRGISIDADITQPNKRKSVINGVIYPFADSLDFRFKAEKIDVGFMKPYMSAFTSDVSGYASGEARLYGTFKFIDMTGRIYAEDLKVKLDYTNTWYTATDSIRLDPGYIGFNNVVLHDTFGNTANLSGYVTHKCFKEPHFKFDITNARNFLCYDVTPALSPDWYGRIFGNGTAFVNGRPGEISIDVNMSTAPNSTFTFVLSDTEAAGEYTFIEFRDRDSLRVEIADTLPGVGTSELSRLLQARIKRQVETSPSLFRINLQADVTPDAQLILVMDPVGGDRIRANGTGNLRLEYLSSDDDFKMFGTYTLERGDYNFTLQDIILKDFTIKQGSSITFHGDPLAASLDIEAIYSVNANLSDLDESFSEDRELNRTNVPVHALLKVSGDMRQPDIAFDLEFPTLSSDTYRKVRSIISTDDMMNRQILYLIALNRFYTPDYMASTTKGSELVSVASSTISSQLSSILGQLSDNWSIAPNVRSDRGDFSDVEVDVALSSHLLNNRLLLNGNLGYRDKSLNNNAFIGDFDIEYLLTPSGNIRLKAYNRYNDQNLYVKTALTTQGVGIVFKRDFDNIFSFLKGFRRKKKEAVTTPAPSDSIPAPAAP